MTMGRGDKESVHRMRYRVLHHSEYERQDEGSEGERERERERGDLRIRDRH